MVADAAAGGWLLATASFRQYNLDIAMRTWAVLVVLIATAALGLGLGHRPPKAALVQGTQVQQPDLIIAGISDAQGMSCARAAGINVTVRNAGAGTAGPSTTSLSVGGGPPQLLATALLEHGEQVTLSSGMTGIPSGETYTAVADYNHDVIESNEDNNSLSQYLILATLPTCTPPPAATPTPTATATASPTPTATCNRDTIGDANKDGTVNAVDAAFVLQYSAGLIGSINPRADANGNGEIDAIDALAILQFGAGLLTCLPP